jgi:uncharacterized membrane protein YgcG
MTHEEPNRPVLQEIENWGARSHRELYESVHIGNDPGQAATLASEWASVGEHIGAASQEIARSLQASEAGWQGAAATKARGAMMQLSTWSEGTAHAAAGVGARVADQALIAQKARDTMPEPVEFDLGAMLMRGFATGGLVGLAIAAADVKAASDRANAAHQQAVQVMATMENESRAVDNTVPVFAMPPNPVRGEQAGQAMMLRGVMAPEGGVEAAQLRRAELAEPAIPESGIPSGEGGNAITPAAVDARAGGSAMNPGSAPAFPGGAPGAPSVPNVPGVDEPAGFASPADQFLASAAGSGSSLDDSPSTTTSGQGVTMPQLPGNFGPPGATPDFTSQRPGTAPQSAPGAPPPFTMPTGVPGTGVDRNQDPARRQSPPIPPVPSTGGGPFGNPGGGNGPGTRPPGGMPPPPFQAPPSGVRGVPTGFGGGVSGNGFTGGGGGVPGSGGAGVPGRPGPGGPGALAGAGPVGGPVPPEERGFGPRGAQAGQPGAPGAMGGMGGMGAGGGRKEEDAEHRSKYVDGEQVVEIPGADLPPSVIGGGKPKKQQG